MSIYTPPQHSHLNISNTHHILRSKHNTTRPIHKQHPIYPPDLQHTLHTSKMMADKIPHHPVVYHPHDFPSILITKARFSDVLLPYRQSLVRCPSDLNRVPSILSHPPEVTYHYSKIAWPGVIRPLLPTDVLPWPKRPHTRERLAAWRRLRRGSSSEFFQWENKLEGVLWLRSKELRQRHGLIPLPTTFGFASLISSSSSSSDDNVSEPDSEAYDSDPEIAAIWAEAASKFTTKTLDILPLADLNFPFVHPYTLQPKSPKISTRDWVIAGLHWRERIKKTCTAANLTREGWREWPCPWVSIAAVPYMRWWRSEVWEMGYRIELVGVVARRGGMWNWLGEMWTEADKREVLRWDENGFLL